MSPPNRAWRKALVKSKGQTVSEYALIVMFVAIAVLAVYQTSGAIISGVITPIYNLF